MSQVQDVKAATDIVALISERVALQHQGTNWRALCPFHSEKSPSFYVSETLQRYRCFGCSESGDVFTFLEKMDGLSFYESLKILAEKSGIALQEHHATDEDRTREKVLEVLHLTAEYYHYLLTEHRTGEVARSYLSGRSIKGESIKLFNLGYSLPSWDGLISYLCDKKKLPLSDLLAAGLVIQNQGGRAYDRFRGRLMFPLTDSRGRIVGFSGRILAGSEKEAKYINTPETVVYHKSQLLYGFSQLFPHIRTSREAVVVEGEFDVIASAQAHVNNVVGVKGSALTIDHIKLLRRTVQTLFLSFDTDKAGIEACRRAIQVARGEGVELRVIVLPPELAAKDPAELATHHPGEWRAAVKSAVSVFEFLINTAVAGENIHSAEGKKKVVNQVAPLFALMTHAVEKAHYAALLAEKLGVKESVLATDLDSLARLGVAVEKKSPPAPSPQSHAVSTRRDRLEKFALFLLLHSEPEQIRERAVQLIQERPQQALVKHVLTNLSQYPGEFQLPDWNQHLPDDLQQFVTELYLEPEAMQTLATIDMPKEWSKVLSSLQALSSQAKVAQLAQELEKIENMSDDHKTDQDKKRQEELLEMIVAQRNK